MPGKLLVFGAGFTGSRLVAALQAEGWQAAGTSRSGENGTLLFEDGGRLAGEALEGVTHVIASVPPGGDGDPVLNAHAGDLARSETLVWAGYLSTTGVYGDHGGAWVDELSETRPTAERSKRRLAAEMAWTEWGKAAGIPVQIFRLAGIYGPGRNALERVRGGKAVRVLKPGHTVGRIHVDDIVRTVRAGMAAPGAGPVFNLADDEPAANADVLAFAADLLGVEPPPAVSFEQAEMTPMARSFYADNRRVSNQRIKSALGISLMYPTYREGLRAILEGN